MTLVTQDTASGAGGSSIRHLVGETSRLNQRFSVAGDRATRRAGLSLARWQVLDAVAAAPLSVSQVARRLGLTRQSVQRTADLLEASGMVRYQDNPDHLRAKLVALSDSGRLALELAERAQRAWTERVAESVQPRDVDSAVTLMRNVRRELDRLDLELATAL